MKNKNVEIQLKSSQDDSSVVSVRVVQLEQQAEISTGMGAGEITNDWKILIDL